MLLILGHHLPPITIHKNVIAIITRLHDGSTLWWRGGGSGEEEQEEKEARVEDG